MNILVTGSGGREHALVRALSLCSSVGNIHALPGSDGISGRALNANIDFENLKDLKKYIDQKNIDLVVVGPETHLATKVTDNLRSSGLAVFGPSFEASQLESSKIFAKNFMRSAGIPTAGFEVINSVETLMRASKKMKPPYVLKADGLAAGKGVVICDKLEDLELQGKKYFDEKIFGKACETALLEEFQEGYELSFLLLTNGESYEPLPLSQDYKKLLEGDMGPNTGGMGAIAPVAIQENLYNQIKTQILDPTMVEIQKRKLLFRGILFIGLMITSEGPKVIEYNVRWGDPETQVLLPLLDGDWGNVFMNLAHGELSCLQWKDLFVACVILAAEGYPIKPNKEALIDGDLNFESPSSYFLHAGCKKQGGAWQVNGGRVLNSIGIGGSQTEALKHAYKQSEKVYWKGLQMRKDIGKNCV